MAEDAFEALARVAADDSKAAIRQRIERESRLQTRSRRIRWTCRAIIVLAGVSGIAMFYFGFFGWALLFLLVAMLTTVVLFFMGGFAPDRVRLLLSDRELRQLDD